MLPTLPTIDMRHHKHGYTIVGCVAGPYHFLQFQLGNRHGNYAETFFIYHIQGKMLFQERNGVIKFNGYRLFIEVLKSTAVYIDE